MQTRRRFLGRVGAGMFVATLGPVVTWELGLARERDLDGSDDAPNLGRFEPLAQLIEESPLDELIPALVAQLRGGLALRDLVAATALANARRCGGTDYDAYHAFMALVPALEMSSQRRDPRAALPALKVVRRNAAFMRAAAPSARAGALPTPSPGDVREHVRRQDLPAAEAAFAAALARGGEHAWDALQPTVRDEADVHRAVLAWRAWDIRRLTGDEHATPLLRQIVRHCVDIERSTHEQGREFTSARRHVPALLESRGFAKTPLGALPRDAAWVDGFARDVFSASCDDAATLVADALAKGVAPRSVGDGLALAATRLVLHQPGRTRSEPGKPEGSMHGAGTGIHAADSIDAWRGIAAAGEGLHVAASLVTAAYYVGGRARSVASAPLAAAALDAEHVEDAAGALASAIDGSDQAAAVAAAGALARLDPSGARAFEVLLGYSCRQDGALHAEKFHRTQQAAFERALPEHRAEHLAALARAVASQQCLLGDGVAEIEALLGS